MPIVWKNNDTLFIKRNDKDRFMYKNRSNSTNIYIFILYQNAVFVFLKKNRLKNGKMENFYDLQDKFR